MSKQMTVKDIALTGANSLKYYLEYNAGVFEIGFEIMQSNVVIMPFAFSNNDEDIDLTVKEAHIEWISKGIDYSKIVNMIVKENHKIDNVVINGTRIYYLAAEVSDKLDMRSIALKYTPVILTDLSERLKVS